MSKYNYLILIIKFCILQHLSIQKNSHAHDLRLIGGNDDSVGIVQIHFNSTWLSMCNLDWEKSNLICTLLGFNGVESLDYTLKTTFNHEQFATLHCQSNASNISHCTLKTIHQCSNDSIGGVTCLRTPEFKKTSRCLSNEFQCSTGICIYKEWVCDGEDDCWDGLDERDCPNYLNEFDRAEFQKAVVDHHQSWRIISREGCARKCSEAEGFICRAFSFRSRSTSLSSLCLLTDKVRSTGLQVESHPHFDYYEKRSIANESVSCDDGFACGDGRCLPSNVICNTQEDCADGSDEKNCVIAEDTAHSFSARLVGGSVANEGRVEVLVDGVWGLVCDDYWDVRDADVFCREVGFPQGAKQAVVNARFGNGNGIFMMDDVRCHGNETSLAQCPFKGWKRHDCFANEIAGVICNNSTADCNWNEFRCKSGKCVILPFLCDGDNDCVDGSDEEPVLCNSTLEIRLVGGVNNSSGRVEIRHRGLWGTICDDSWDDADAQVVCRSLGWHGTAKAHGDSSFGDGTGPIWLDDVHCFGLEQSLEECEKSPWLNHNCNHKEDAGVTCSSGEEISSTPPEIEELLPKKCGKRVIDDFPRTLAAESARVIGGMDSEYGAHPWLAAIRVKAGRSSLHWCGASIIHQFFLLSAAHCFEELPINSFVIRSGDYDNEKFEAWEEEYSIADIYIHENFNHGQKFNNDIALIRIKADEDGRGFRFGPFVSAVCLPHPNTLYTPGTRCFISGWGSTGNRVASRLQVAEVPILSRAVCSKPLSYGPRRLTAGMFCAGDMAGGVDSCRGDSGGPLVCRTEGHFTLLGVVSWGQGCAQPNKPGIYVTVRHYLGWIYGKLSEYAANESRALILNDELHVAFD